METANVHSINARRHVLLSLESTCMHFHRHNFKSRESDRAKIKKHSGSLICPLSAPEAGGTGQDCSPFVLLRN
jgi:hypothetical protein